jgi:hypothetical protein
MHFFVRWVRWVRWLFDKLAFFLSYHEDEKSHLNAAAGPGRLDLRLCTLDFGLWTLDFGLWTLDFGPRTVDTGLWTDDPPPVQIPVPAAPPVCHGLSRPLSRLEPRKTVVNIELSRRHDPGPLWSSGPSSRLPRRHVPPKL